MEFCVPALDWMQVNCRTSYSMYENKENRIWSICVCEIFWFLKIDFFIKMIIFFILYRIIFGEIRWRMKKIIWNFKEYIQILASFKILSHFSKFFILKYLRIFITSFTFTCRNFIFCSYIYYIIIFFPFSCYSYC